MRPDSLTPVALRKTPAPVHLPRSGTPCPSGRGAVSAGQLAYPGLDGHQPAAEDLGLCAQRCIRSGRLRSPLRSRKSGGGEGTRVRGFAGAWDPVASHTRARWSHDNPARMP
jgi:hypothetical protein